MKSQKPKQRPSKAELTINIGSAIVALGLFLIYLFVPPEQLTGPTFLHLLRIFFVILAVICALGIAYMAIKKKKKQKQ